MKRLSVNFLTHPKTFCNLQQGKLLIWFSLCQIQNVEKAIKDKTCNALLKEPLWIYCLFCKSSLTMPFASFKVDFHNYILEEERSGPQSTLTTPTNSPFDCFGLGL